MFRKLDPMGAAPTLVTITIDGLETPAEAGEPVAAILLRTAPFFARRTPVSGTIRAPYCMMGACFECLVEIDGESSVRGCLAQARSGMAVRRQIARPDPARIASA